MNRRISIANEILLEEVSHLIAQGHSATIRVKGNSMRPFLIGGKDKIRLVPVVELHKYDVVLAKIDQRYVLHRIVEIQETEIALMGDGNLSLTEKCTSQEIIAKAESRIRNGNEQRLPLVRPRLWILLLPFRRFLLHFIAINR